MDWTALTLSLQLAGLTVLILLPLSVMLARWIAWSGGRAVAAIEALVMLPLVLPPTVLGYYLLVGLSPGNAIGAFFATLAGGPLVFSFAGLVLASLIVNLPFAVQPMARAFEAIPQSVREAAWVSGLSRWQTFWRIEAPLAWPGVLSAAALVFAHTLGEFGVILMVGGSIPGETRTLAISIYDKVQAFQNEAAGLMAGVLLAVSFAAIAVMHVAGRQRRQRMAPVAEF
ncbi:MAG: molybdate ABC transporter permease subunit [Pseudomonadota bacterium]